MSTITAVSNASPSSSSQKPWKSWIYSKGSKVDKDRINFADGREDQDFMEGAANLSLDETTAERQEISAEPAAISPVSAVVRGSWRVGIWRRENNRHQKRHEVLLSRSFPQDGPTLFRQMDEKEDIEVVSRRRGREEILTEKEQLERGAEIPRERDAKWREDAALVEKYTVHDEATLITCAAGLEVWHVVTGFDLCTMKIKNLPKDSKESEIADILVGRNVPFPEFLITQHQTTRDTSQAVVLVGKEVGRALALELEGLEFRDKMLGIEVGDHTTRQAMVFTEQLSPYLTVSWKGQTDTLIASYPSNVEAMKRARDLNGMLWKGQRLAASLNQYQRASPSSTNSVKITRYPPDATSDMEFLDFIGTRSYRILKTKPYNHQCTLIMVRIRLRQQHGVRMETYEELTPPADVDETRVTVHFNGWEDVKRAYTVFHRKKLGTGEEMTPTLRASYPSPFQFSIKVSRRQFQAQEGQWKALKETKQGKEAYLYTTQLGDKEIIYILGNDLRTTGALKVRVEKLISGKVLDPSHWHPDFANDSSKQFFKRVHAETGVHIKIETRTQILKIFGEPDKVADAGALIKAEVQRMETRGDDKLDADHDQCSGLNLVGNRGEGSDHLIKYSFSEDRSELRAPCVICYCEASAPERLGCGHVYCTGCLRHLLASAADTRNFPITCIGNDATCNTPLPIPVIRRHMKNQAFQHLVEAAFASHLEQHPDEYRYCRTPDCKQIYRLRRKEAQQCPSCFLKICLSCEEEFHEGMTCEERRLQRDPALLEQLKESLGYRKCPQCSAWIEKAGGCNHVTCKCGGHICWRCMGHFPVGEIYKHLSTARCKIYKPSPETWKSGPHPIEVVQPGLPLRQYGVECQRALELRGRTRERGSRSCVIM